MTDTREATPRPWGLCFHLQSAENDASCKCGYRGSIWSACGEYIVCEMGSSPDHDETGKVAGHSAPQAYRHIQLADAALIVRAVNHFDEVVEVLRILAAEADEWGDAVPDDHRPVYVEMDHWDARYYGSPSRFTVGDLRRIRALLSKLEASHGSA